MRTIFIILCVLFMATQCEAPIDCTDPDCVGSPINFKLEATLSDTSSVFGLNDTLKMYIPVPDSIRSEYGNYSISNIDGDRSWFIMDMIIIDNIVSDQVWEGEQLINNVKCLVNGIYKTKTMKFDAHRRMAEIHFTFPRKGKYYIASRWSGVKFIFRQENQDWLQAGAYIGLNVENQHQDLYLSWIPSQYHNQMLDEFKARKEAGLFWYAFEVK